MTPYEVIYREDGEVSTIYFESLDEMFYETAKAIAFADCVDDFKILCMRGDNCSYHYAGWQPDMVFTFLDEFSGEIAWENSFANWEH